MSDMHDDEKGMPPQFAGVGFLALMLVGLLLVLVFFAGRATAQTTARTATISFAAPTRYTDGSTIAAGTTISYRVYQGARTGTKTQVGTITGTTTTINSGLQAGQEYCWEVTAVINNVESERSVQGCKSFPFPTPETVTITVT